MKKIVMNVIIVKLKAYYDKNVVKIFKNTSMSKFRHIYTHNIHTQDHI